MVTSRGGAAATTCTFCRRRRYLIVSILFAFVWWAVSSQCDIGLRPARIFGGGSRRRRGCRVDIPRRRDDVGIRNFNNAFVFSVETIMTIGYGTRDQFFDNCWEASVLIFCEAMTSILMDCVSLGIVYSRISSGPARYSAEYSVKKSRGGRDADVRWRRVAAARWIFRGVGPASNVAKNRQDVRRSGRRRSTTILFSDRAIVQTIEGELYLMFQVVEMRRHPLHDAKVRVYAVRDEVDAWGRKAFFQHCTMRRRAGAARQRRVF